MCQLFSVCSISPLFRKLSVRRVKMMLVEWYAGKEVEWDRGAEKGEKWKSRISEIPEIRLLEVIAMLLQCNLIAFTM